MKNTITLVILSLMYFVGFTQNQDKVGIISKNAKGVIASVKFFYATAKSKIPASVNVFGGVRGGLSS